MPKRRPKWWFKRKPKKPAIDPTLPFGKQIEILQKNISRRRVDEEAKKKREEVKKQREEAKERRKVRIEEVVLSEYEVEQVTVRWLYETDPKIKRQLAMLMLLGMGRTVQFVAETMVTDDAEILAALKLIQ
jgi:hypothetical protein